MVKLCNYYNSTVSPKNEVEMIPKEYVGKPRLCVHTSSGDYAVPILLPNTHRNIEYNDKIYRYSKGRGVFRPGSTDELWVLVKLHINGQECDIPQNLEIEEKYQIPAGTYTPSTFRSMLNSYLSSGNAKRIDNTVTFTQNNKTWTVNANSGYIRRRDWSSGGTERYDVITFNQTSQPDNASPGTCIILYAETRFTTYDNYPITVSAGFNFV